MLKFSRRSKENLRGVHPDMVALAYLMLYFLSIDTSGPVIDIAVVEGVRYDQRQRELFLAKKSLTLNSMHKLQPDGWGHAFDVVAVGDLNGDGVVDHKDKEKRWDPEIYRRIDVAAAKAAALLGIKYKWGGTFRGLFDGPHFQKA